MVKTHHSSKTLPRTTCVHAALVQWRIAVKTGHRGAGRSDANRDGEPPSS